MVTAPTKRETIEPESAAAIHHVVSIKLRLPPCWDPTDEALIELARNNECWRFELTAERELVIMSPEGRGSSKRGMRIGSQIEVWSLGGGGGEVLGPDMGIRLEDGSLKMPDVAWISDDRLDDDDDEGLLRRCPDLVIEIVSRSDSEDRQLAKMVTWLANGALLGWLIDPFRDTVTRFKPDKEPERLERPNTLSGEDVCEGLEVRLERVWKEQ